MEIYSVYDEDFVPYGRVLQGYRTKELIEAMEKIPLPAEGTAYEPSIRELEDCEIFKEFENRGYGGMPVQLGMCWGRNAKLNCLEYHRDSEINIGDTDFILLLAMVQEIEDGELDTENVMAFEVPAGVPVEIYATTLHYAPCETKESGFRVAVVLPRGTNTEMPVFEPKTEEDKWMAARNKWLLAHEDAPEARSGAYIGLYGDNIEI